MPITLHVDLLATDLWDFDDHFVRFLNQSWFFRTNHEVVCRYQTTVERPNYPAEHMAPSGFWGEDPHVLLDFELDLEWIPEQVDNPVPGFGYVVYLKRVVGNTDILYTYMIVAELSDGKVSILEEPLGFFFFTATRYRTDRVKILMFEEDQAVLSQYFLEWLRPRWGDAVLELPLQAAPIMPLRRTPGRPRYASTEHALERLRAGEPVDQVRADWREDYRRDAGAYPHETEDGEHRTWQKRVWSVYLRDAMGA